MAVTQLRVIFRHKNGIDRAVLAEGIEKVMVAAGGVDADDIVIIEGRRTEDDFQSAWDFAGAQMGIES